MRTIGTRELKQNPNAVIQRVIQSGEGAEITAHGHLTGAKIVPSAPLKAPWVHASAFSRITPMLDGQTQAFVDDVELAREDDDRIDDPWVQR